MDKPGAKMGIVLTALLLLTGIGAADSHNQDRVTLSESFIEGEPTQGDASAELVIIEISDFGCPWCAEWAGVDAIPQRPIDEEQSYDQVISNHVETGDARFVYKDYPVEQLHPNAPQAHEAANCIYEQGDDLYWEFHDALFEQRDEWTAGGANNPETTFRSIAQDIGADADAMDSCIESSDGSEVQQDTQEIRDAVGQVGTPSFLIGTFEDGFVLVEGAQPYSNLQQVINNEPWMNDTSDTPTTDGPTREELQSRLDQQEGRIAELEEEVQALQQAVTSLRDTVRDLTNGDQTPPEGEAASPENESDPSPEDGNRSNRPNLGSLFESLFG